MENFKKLNPHLIEKHLFILYKRIDERFPDSGLLKVSEEVLRTIRAAKEKAEEFRRPNYYIRLASAFLIFMILTGIVYMVMNIDFHDKRISIFELFQAVEAGVNDLVFISIMVWFLTGLENKIKRKKALAAMTELRSLIHVIDMHQLNKDPQLLIVPGPNTESSPERFFTPFQMGRYLNYCSEMLSGIGKISAYYIESLNDQTVLNTAMEIEELTNGINQKIWEKINIIYLDDDN